MVTLRNIKQPLYYETGINHSLSHAYRPCFLQE